jgi:methionyl-tRNA formyltransferase
MRLVFMGTPAAAAHSLARCILDGHEIAAVYTQPDRPSGRGQKIVQSPVKQLGLLHGIPVLQPKAVRTLEAAEMFRSHAADVAVVVAYGRILPAAFLTAFPNGAINVHYSLLPKYRGAAPVNWAIVNGETETGVTTMRMDEGLDTGDILLQRTTHIAADETSIGLMDRLSELGAELLTETLAGLATLAPLPQDHSNATLAPIMSKDDGAIDWNLPANDIRNRIRGFQPFPSAYTSFRGETIKLWRASLADGASDTLEPAGTVISAFGTLDVATGENTILRMEEMQPAGKRRMEARDFINGLKPQVGEMFGQ